MILKRVEPFSLAKLSAVLYAVVGLIAGCFIALFSLVGGAASQMAGSGAPGFGMFFGVGAVVLLPILYGIGGFVGSLIMATLYNFLAKMVGGVELHLE